MGTMASLLQTIEARQDSKPQKKRRHSFHELSSADSESEATDHEASSKRRREEGELSISPSDEDITEFLKESSPKEVEMTAKTAEPNEEVEPSFWDLPSKTYVAKQVRDARDTNKI